VTLDCQ